MPEIVAAAYSGELPATLRVAGSSGSLESPLTAAVGGAGARPARADLLLRPTVSAHDIGASRRRLRPVHAPAGILSFPAMILRRIGKPEVVGSGSAPKYTLSGRVELDRPGVGYELTFVARGVPRAVTVEADNGAYERFPASVTGFPSDHTVRFAVVEQVNARTGEVMVIDFVVPAATADFDRGRRRIRRPGHCY